MRRTFLTFAFTLLPFLASSFAASAGTVTGSATYLQKIAVPQGATLSVKLLDTSLADAPAKLLASKEINVDGIPVPFSLDYDDAEIDPRFTYSIDIEMRGDEMLLFRSTTNVPVITHGAPNHVDVILEMISASNPSLTGTSWEFRVINGTEITSDRKPNIQFGEDSVVSIDSTCNKMNGQITIENSSLTFSPNMMGTLMACPEPYNSMEAEVSSLLSTITGYSVLSGQLNFFNATNKTVANLVLLEKETK